MDHIEGDREIVAPRALRTGALVLVGLDNIPRSDQRQ